MALILKKLVGKESYDKPVYTKSFQGKAIALSEDSLTMAIGAPEHDHGIGGVFIYFRQSIISPWIQESHRLIGSGYKGVPHQGTSISLSADGNTLASGGPDDDSGVGAVWMFKRIDGSWYQTQEKIFSWAENDGQLFGQSVSLSGDGLTLAIGVPRYKYYWSTNWSGTTPIGATWICYVEDNIWKLYKRLIGNVRSGRKSKQGTCVSLSYDGSTLAVSGYGENGHGDVFVFGKENMYWFEKEHKAFSHSHDVSFGKNVSISGDGLTLAYGTYYTTGHAGHTIICIKKNKTEWAQNNLYISGNLLHIPYLNKDGSRIVIAALQNDGKDFEIFIKSRSKDGTDDKYDKDKDRTDKDVNWKNITDPIHPGMQSDIASTVESYPIVMSGNGLCFAIGTCTHKNSDGIESEGGVRTYTLTDSSNPSSWTVSPLIIGSDFIGRPGQGNAIVMSEDGLTMFVGGYQDMNFQGSVWVYVRDNPNSNEWKQSGNKLVPKDAIGQSKHGYSLALASTHAGDILVVGGPGDNHDRGAIWVYKKAPGGGWIPCNQSKLVEFFPNVIKDEMSQYMTKYGSSVGISDNYLHDGIPSIRIVTGGPNDELKMGCVLVFDGLDGLETEFHQTSKIYVTTSGELSAGESVAISSDGKTIAIGCPGNGNGAVLLFNHIEDSWILDPKTIRGPESIKKSKQGSSISMDKKGETLAIGGPADNGGIGAVWIFKRVNNKWEFKTKIICPDTIGPSRAGSSVNLSRDGLNLVIGGPGDNDDQGAAWAYKLVGDDWNYLDQKYVGDLHKKSPRVGSSVCIGNHMIAMGGPTDDEGVGAVWVGNYTHVRAIY